MIKTDREMESVVVVEATGTGLFQKKTDNPLISAIRGRYCCFRRDQFLWPIRVASVDASVDLMLIGFDVEYRK